MPRPPGVRPDGDKLRQLIEDRGYPSVKAFARARRRWHPNTIRHFVAGHQRASLKYIREMAEVLGVDPSELIRDDDEPEARVA